MTYKDAILYRQIQTWVYVRQYQFEEACKMFERIYKKQGIREGYSIHAVRDTLDDRFPDGYVNLNTRKL